MKTSPTMVSFVARSKQRKSVLLQLKKESLSQAEIQKATAMYKSHTSRTIAELEKKKLIICLNPKDRVYRFFKITPLGMSIIKRVEKIVS